MQCQDTVIWYVGIPTSGNYQKMESPEGHIVLLNAMSFAIFRKDIASFMVEQCDNSKYIHSISIIGS